MTILRLRRSLHAALLALCTTAATAASTPPAAEPIQAVRLLHGEHIVLDGTLSHPAWQRAPVFDRSYEIEPVRGHVPTHATRVQVLRSLSSDRSRGARANVHAVLR